MKEENLPQFEIRMTQNYNEQLKIYDNNVWLFFNRGGKLSEFQTKEYSFCNITYNTDNETLALPLYSYLNMRGVLTGESEGLIYTVDNNHNGLKELALSNSISNFGFFEIETHIKVSYIDIFNQHHEEYFQIGNGFGTNRISEQKWNTIKSNYKKSKNKYMFSKLNAKKIIDLKKHR